MFPFIAHARYIALARGYSSGPALTLKNSLKLKWNDPTVLKDALTATLDRPPLNLRDGSIIVVRGVADFARAEVIMRQKKQQAALEAEARPVSRGLKLVLCFFTCIEVGSSISNDRCGSCCRAG